jgi:hypothetical protein
MNYPYSKFRQIASASEPYLDSATPIKELPLHVYRPVSIYMERVEAFEYSHRSMEYTISTIAIANPKPKTQSLIPNP